MVLKTFNVDEGIHAKFSQFCKEHGISMSKQIELYMESQIGDEFDNRKVKPSYLKKLAKIREGKYHKFNTIAELRKLIENDKL